MLGDPRGVANSSAMPMLTMAELGSKAGAGKLVMEYLECRGILSVGTLASTG